jgi:Zn finger protein HypA/HybF involved in hydrogenase expression
MSECDWFCANCLQMIEVLSKRGRCPYCDSDAVDVAYRCRSTESESGLTPILP